MDDFEPRPLMWVPAGSATLRLVEVWYTPDNREFWDLRAMIDFMPDDSSTPEISIYVANEDCNAAWRISNNHSTWKDFNAQADATVSDMTAMAYMMCLMGLDTGAYDRTLPSHERYNARGEDITPFSRTAVWACYAPQQALIKDES